MILLCWIHVKLIHIVRLISFNPIEWVAKSSSGFDTKTLCTKSSRETAQLTGSIQRAQSHLARCDPPFGTCACQWRPCSTVWLDLPSMAWVGPDAGVWWWTRQEMPWCGRRRRRMSYCGIDFIKQVSNELNKKNAYPEKREQLRRWVHMPAKSNSSSWSRRSTSLESALTKIWMQLGGWGR